MIDREFGNAIISFELSIGSSGYLTPLQLANHQITSSITRPYPRVPIDNNEQHFRLPIDLQKPILFTKYNFHDYTYRMTVSNRLKQAADHLLKLIQKLETHLKKNCTPDIAIQAYREIERYVHIFPCGCGEVTSSNDDNFGLMGVVHQTLPEILKAPKLTLRMNSLDEKRHKRIVHNLESLKGWIISDIQFDEIDRLELIEQLMKIPRILQQLAVDVQPSLPDVFLWMICDTKRVAYARIPPEDLLHSICVGERGLHNGRVQTLFLRRPTTSDKLGKLSTNAKVQVYLWLGTEEQQGNIFKHLPPGFEMPSLPLSNDLKSLRYHGKSLYELRCHCYRARSLLALDDTGLSDPYLSITAGNETQTTPIQIQSLCPQWNMTIVFKRLMHVGSREQAEDIIGHVVVECYDYDPEDNRSEFMGRFSTRAKLDLSDHEDLFVGGLFHWYAFELDNRKFGELLAVFELIEVDPESGDAQTSWRLNEIEITPENFPPESYITKFMKNPIYEIPQLISLPTQSYEIDVMFWGLRECRSINLQSIQQAEVSIDCAGVRLTKTIKNVQKNPNFEYSPNDNEEHKLLVNLPKSQEFWPYVSITCVQNRLFGMKEAIGGLVITDFPKYMEKSNKSFTDLRRVQQSLVDACEAVRSPTNDKVAKQKLTYFENTAGLKSIEDDERALVTNDDRKIDEGEGVLTTNLTDPNESTGANPHRSLTIAEKLKRKEMEKSANWWTKYYASKAKRKLEEKMKTDYNEGLASSDGEYAQLFVNGRGQSVKRQQQQQQQPFWSKAKVIFAQVGKAQKKFTTVVKEKLDEERQYRRVADDNIDFIETDRMKELSLLQTFDIIDTDLENVRQYEGFHDCFDKFSLYKGKGVSRSDEQDDENRIYAKFKGKFRIREVAIDDTLVPTHWRVSVNPTLLNAELKSAQSRSNPDSNTKPKSKINEKMLEFDLNRNPIGFLCRLYVIKALLFRSRDHTGRADPFIKILLNNDLIIDDAAFRIHNTLEPIFGKCYEFEATIPYQSLLRIQVWDWDLVKLNEKIGETSIDIEDRWLSCHRATCGLPKRYDSAGYNAWRDTKTPVMILNELCQATNRNLPIYANDMRSLAIGDVRFDCDYECVEFVKGKNDEDLHYRKAHHEPAEEYLRQNTALAALHGWGEKIDQNGALVTEHIECRTLYDPKTPDVEQGKLEMWLDIFPMSRPPSSAPVNITPLKPLSYQLRVIIWNTSDVELDDENFITGEKTSDIYVKAWILGENEDGQQTDVHYRSLTGEGNFNWRFVFDFDYLDIEEKIIHEKKESILRIGTLVRKIPPRMVIRVYDADLISADDFLGQCILDLTHLPIGAKSPKKCTADLLLDSTQKSVNLFATKRAAGWWPMLAPLKAREIRDVRLLGGKVEAEFSLVTKEDAEKNPVGKAREGPSALDEPDRPKTSFLWFTSPWKTFRFVIWRNFKWPLIIGITIIIFVIFLLLAVWSIPGQVVTQVVNKIFKTGGTGR